MQNTIIVFTQNIRGCDYYIIDLFVGVINHCIILHMYRSYCVLHSIRYCDDQKISRFFFQVANTIFHQEIYISKKGVSNSCTIVLRNKSIKHIHAKQKPALHVRTRTSDITTDTHAYTQTTHICTHTQLCTYIHRQNTPQASGRA